MEAHEKLLLKSTTRLRRKEANESSVDKEDLKRFNCQSFQVFFPFTNNTGLNNT